MTLQIIRCLDIRVRTHEPAYQRVINAPIHVDDAHLIDVLMHGEATVDVLASDGVQGVGAAVDLSALAPRVIGQALNHDACVVGDGHDGAQLVVVQVAAGVGLCAGGQGWGGDRAACG